MAAFQLLGCGRPILNHRRDSVLVLFLRVSVAPNNSIG